MNSLEESFNKLKVDDTTVETSSLDYFLTRSLREILALAFKFKLI
jgi:hypothetical protein